MKPAPAASALAAPDTRWTLSHPEAPVPGVPEVLETRWVAARPPGGPHDQIELHRYRSREPRLAALLYLPGANMNAEMAVPDEEHNLWIFLARRGVEVYALDYRTRFVPASGLSDFAFMRDWGLASFLGDARAAAEQARRESGRAQLFVAGFSRGVSLAYALAAAEGPAIAGLIALDGAFKSHAPQAQYDFAAEAKKLEASGTYASDVAGRLGWEKRQQMMKATATDASQPALDTKFASVGAQVADVLYNAWRPGALANPIDGFSRVETLARLLVGYDRYYPAIQDLEGRSLADRDDDPRTGLDDAWGEMKTPVLYFGATGMGAEWLMNGIYSAARSGSEDVTVHVLEGYGHLDVVVGEKARQDVFEPTLAWIRKRAR